MKIIKSFTVGNRLFRFIPPFKLKFEPKYGPDPDEPKLEPEEDENEEPLPAIFNTFHEPRPWFKLKELDIEVCALEEELEKDFLNWLVITWDAYVNGNDVYELLGESSEQENEEMRNKFIELMEEYN